MVRFHHHLQSPSPIHGLLNAKTIVPDDYKEPIPGLLVYEDFLSAEEENQILRYIDYEDVVEWKHSNFNGQHTGKRWGVHCNLRDRRVDSPQHDLPSKIFHQIIFPKLLPILKKLYDRGMIKKQKTKII